MGLKDKVMAEGMRLASHPAVASVLQDERFMKLLMTALSLPGRLDELTEEQKANFIRAMNLATNEQISDLTRTVRNLEGEIHRLRAELGELRNARASSDD